MIIALLAIGLVVAVGLAGVAYMLSCKSRKLVELTDDELRSFTEMIETQAKARAELFGDNIYDVHRSR